jgi:hypothetical protein
MKKLKRVKIFSAVKVETAENMYELFANDPNIEVSETKFSTSFDALGPRITMAIFYTDKVAEEETTISPEKGKILDELLIEQIR